LFYPKIRKKSGHFNDISSFAFAILAKACSFDAGSTAVKISYVPIDEYRWIFGFLLWQAFGF